MIMDAALELLQERGIDGFTVADLAERADLNRSTFYSHFKDKDELIRYYEQEFFDELGAIEARLGDIGVDEAGALENDPLEVFVELFDLLRERAPILQVLLGPAGDIGFEHRLLDFVCATIEHKVLFSKYRDSENPVVAYYVSYFSHAALGVVRTWIDRGMKESSEEIANILIHVAFLRPGEPIEMDE